MTCADFERKLTGLIAGEAGPGGGEADLASLREHAASCASCRGTADLLELLTWPGEERDLVESPPEPYWDRFEAELGQRLARGASRSRWGWAPWTGVAASLLLAAMGLWLVFAPGTGGPVEGRAEARPAGSDPIPEDLEVLLRAAQPGDALEGLDFLAGLAGLPEAAREGLETAPGGEGPAEPAGLFYPDPEAMDTEVRRALLNWLRENAGRERGVES
jgi:hypothetical protein